MSATDSGPRVLDVPADWSLPKLGKRVVPPSGTVRSEQGDHVVTAYDTADGDLAALDVAVERGPRFWTLRVEGTTSEFPATGRGVPAELRGLLLGVRSGAALRVSERARVRTTVHRVSDGTGVELGTITEVVRAPAGEPARRWLEVAGWTGFAEAAVRRLITSDAVERPAVIPPAGAAAQGSVGAALLIFLREQRRVVLRADLDLRGGTDSVHAFRVAIRRIRSALRVVTVADEVRVAALDAELRWLAQVLGAVRDLQVLRAHLDDSLDAAPFGDGSTIGEVTRRAITAALDADEVAARAALTSVLAGRRYLALLRVLREWCAEPPFTAAADQPERRLGRYVKAAAKDLDRRLAKAGTSAERLHGARKAAKRARYVAAFAGQSAGKHAPVVVRRAKTLQTRLGDHQDAVLASDYVARLGARSAGEIAFGCGVLWSYEQDRAKAVLARVGD